MAEVLCVYREVKIIKETAAAAKQKPSNAVAIISYDEKPGIQAIAVTAPDLPAGSGGHSEASGVEHREAQRRQTRHHQLAFLPLRVVPLPGLRVGLLLGLCDAVRIAGRDEASGAYASTFAVVTASGLTLQFGNLMSFASQPYAQDDDELEAVIDQAIDACGGKMRATIRALIVADIGKRGQRTDEGHFSRLHAWEISDLFRLGACDGPSNLFVALPFIVAEDGLAPGEANECFSPTGVIARAEALSRKPGLVGAIAFSRTGDPATGEFGDAKKFLKTFGKVGDLGSK